MALLLAMLRTLVDEELEPRAAGRAAERADLPAQPGLAVHHAVLRVYTPSTGALTYVNAGQNPPLIRRARRLDTSGSAAPGIALGMFDGSTYDAVETRIDPGELLVLYSDGITEAENPAGQPFEEAGLEAVVDSHPR